MPYLIYPCGCKFKILDDSIVDDIYVNDSAQTLPQVEVDLDNISKDCTATWDLISEGNTIGVFQLESNLGRSWSKKIQPHNIKELADIIAAIRPGCLESFLEDGKNLTHHYCERKHKREELNYNDGVLKEILGNTQEVILYQEQAILLASKLAGFDLQSADKLRRGIGHKDAQIIKDLEDQFISGCEQVGIVTKEDAIQIFEWIKASQRYSFNRCIFGGTRILRTKNKYSFYATIEEMYNIRNDINYAKKTGHLNLYKKWKMYKNYCGCLSMCDDGRVRPNTINDIVYEGKQDVYKVTLTNQASIICTLNHKFPTPNGQLRLSDLKVGDCLYMCGESCYKSVHYDELNRTKKGQKGYPTFLSAIKSIEYYGEENVYNVEVSGPNHNFAIDSGIITSNSHAVGYASLGYKTAFCKAHFPLQFYTAYLQGSIYKQKPLEEIKILINDAKKQNIEVLPPDIRDLHNEFYIQNKHIRFGISDIKNIGTAAVKSILTAIQEVEKELNKPVDEWSWIEFLVYCSDRINNSAYEALIYCGACDCFGIERHCMIYELNIYNMVSPGEKKWILANFSPKWTTLVDILRDCGKIKKEGGGCHSIKRSAVVIELIDSLINPPHNTAGNLLTLAQNEEKYLGVGIIINKIDGKLDANKATHTIKDFSQSKEKFAIVACELNRIKKIRTSKGKNPGQEMAFIDISDSSDSIDGAVCFPNVYLEYGEILYEENIVLAQIERNTKQEGFIINKLWQI
jgi:DNA polymerase III alpha subunit